MNAASESKGNTGTGTGWLLAWGVLLIIAGVLAVMMPAFAALATAMMLGWLLVLGGIFGIVHAVQTRALEGFGWRLTSGILILLLGILVLVMPMAAVASLALLVGSFLLAGGIVGCVFAFRLKPMKGWGWVLFDGLVSIVLAVLIMIGWPQSSVAFIGLLTGFSLISNGVARIMLRNALRP
ncbi:HdeD family acid-resistance protein [Aerolutibacter ruishenii]|uniref:Uncharacterized membrane protein HdeD (DUF308 family) n=1 Tax=Aerolutibacter ruishenii TaxID=686800 RepID=A0A562LCM0_9GAMM|nr:HdeD family acid-resistance protein [Lysobacter ruishenii]TWI05391.1 uncharacterized membrane protein HdeD (DUF308 family) [Lysobacter ruishenii]